MQTWRQGLGERGSRKQRFENACAAEGAGQGCFPWPPALFLDEHTAGFTVLGLPSQRDHFRRRSICMSTCPVALEQGLDGAYKQPLTDGQDKGNPGSPTFRARFDHFCAAGRGEQEALGAPQVYRAVGVREAWRKRHSTVAHTRRVLGGTGRLPG